MLTFTSCTSEQKTKDENNLPDVLTSETDTICVKNGIWSFTDTSKLFFEKYYKSEFDTSEIACIKKSQDLVSRNEDTLFIKIDGNKIKKYINDNSIESDSYTEYHFMSKLPGINYYLVKIYYYEGYSYMMLNAKTGKESYLWGIPSVSPDNKKIMASCFDLQAGFVFNGIQYFDITPDSLQLQWSRELNKWGSDKLAWINNDMLVAERLTMDSVFNIKSTYTIIKPFK